MTIIDVAGLEVQLGGVINIAFRLGGAVLYDS